MLKMPGPNSVIPKPCLNGTACTACQACISGTGSGAPPLVTKRTLEKSVSAKRGASSSCWYWVGTAKKSETRSRAISSSASPGSHRRWITTVPPTVSSGSVYTSSPPVWNIGVWVSVTSPGRSSWTRVLSVFHAIIRWVMRAPFGSPVVPPVKRRQTTSSSLTCPWTGTRSTGRLRISS